MARCRSNGTPSGSKRFLKMNEIFDHCRMKNKLESKRTLRYRHGLFRISIAFWRCRLCLLCQYHILDSLLVRLGNRPDRLIAPIYDRIDGLHGANDKVREILFVKLLFKKRRDYYSSFENIWIAKLSFSCTKYKPLLGALTQNPKNQHFNSCTYRESNNDDNKQQ